MTPVHWKKLKCVFEKVGFKLDRIEGDHMILIKPKVKRPIVIQRIPQIDVALIKSNMRTAGISRKASIGAVTPYFVIVRLDRTIQILYLDSPIKPALDCDRGAGNDIPCSFWPFQRKCPGKKRFPWNHKTLPTH